MFLWEPLESSELYWRWNGGACRKTGETRKNRRFLRGWWNWNLRRSPKVRPTMLQNRKLVWKDTSEAHELWSHTDKLLDFEGNIEQINVSSRLTVIHVENSQVLPECKEISVKLNEGTRPINRVQRNTSSILPTWRIYRRCSFGSVRRERPFLKRGNHDQEKLRSSTQSCTNNLYSAVNIDTAWGTDPF